MRESRCLWVWAWPALSTSWAPWDSRLSRLEQTIHATEELWRISYPQQSSLTFQTLVKAGREAAAHNHHWLTIHYLEQALGVYGLLTSSHNLDIHKHLVIAYGALHRPREVLQHLQTYLSTSLANTSRRPDELNSLLHVSWTLMPALAAHTKSLHELLQSLHALSPEHCPVHDRAYHMARVFMALGDHEQAHQWLTKAIELTSEAPVRAQLLLCLAWVETYDPAQYSSAAHSLRQVDNIWGQLSSPLQQRVRRIQGHIWERMGEFALAKEAYAGISTASKIYKEALHRLVGLSMLQKDWHAAQNYGQTWLRVAAPEDPRRGFLRHLQIFWHLQQSQPEETQKDLIDEQRHLQEILDHLHIQSTHHSLVGAQRMYQHIQGTLPPTQLHTDLLATWASVRAQKRRLQRLQEVWLMKIGKNLCAQSFEREHHRLWSQQHHRHAQLRDLIALGEDLASEMQDAMGQPLSAHAQNVQTRIHMAQKHTRNPRYYQSTPKAFVETRAFEDKWNQLWTRLGQLETQAHMPIYDHLAPEDVQSSLKRVSLLLQKQFPRILQRRCRNLEEGETPHSLPLTTMALEDRWSMLRKLWELYQPQRNQVTTGVDTATIEHLEDLWQRIEFQVSEHLGRIHKHQDDLSQHARTRWRLWDHSWRRQHLLAERLQAMEARLASLATEALVHLRSHYSEALHRQIDRLQTWQGGLLWQQADAISKAQEELREDYELKCAAAQTEAQKLHPNPRMWWNL